MNDSVQFSLGFPDSCTNCLRRLSKSTYHFINGVAKLKRPIVNDGLHCGQTLSFGRNYDLNTH